MSFGKSGGKRDAVINGSVSLDVRRLLMVVCGPYTQPDLVMAVVTAGQLVCISSGRAEVDRNGNM
jgi:hypothetical protein